MSVRLTTYPLTHPVEHKGKTYEALTPRRPKVKDLIKSEVQPTETGREAALLGILSDVPFSAIGEMDVTDYHSIVTRTGIDFLSVSGSAARPAGPSSSSTPGPTGGSTSS